LLRVSRIRDGLLVGKSISFSETDSGVDVFTGKIVDMYRKGVIEPLRVKEQAVKSATEVASAILRVDDVIAATTPKEYKAPPLDEGMEE
jgi:chaperonin GroEL (HSP60 family)